MTISQQYSIVPSIRPSGESEGDRRLHNLPNLHQRGCMVCERFDPRGRLPCEKTFPLRASQRPLQKLQKKVAKKSCMSSNERVDASNLARGCMSMHMYARFCIHDIVLPPLLCTRSLDYGLGIFGHGFLGRCRKCGRGAESAKSGDNIGEIQINILKFPSWESDDPVKRYKMFATFQIERINTNSVALVSSWRAIVWMITV